MLKPDQVSLYFLNELDKFCFFVELSERHWQEEFVRYSESDLEKDEATCWDRYKYRSDLSSYFGEVFPQYQTRSLLLMLVSLFEDYMNQLCLSFESEQSLCCCFKDINGSGIERAKKYLEKVAKVHIPVDSSAWVKITQARDIRNLVAHNAGHLDKQSHSKQLGIVGINIHLKLHEFARDHLEIEPSFVKEIVDAMTEFVKELLSKNAENT